MNQSTNAPPDPYRLLTRRTSRRELLVASGAGLAGATLLGSLAACGDDDEGATGEVLLSIGADLKEIVTGQIKAFNREQGQDGVTASLRVMPTDTSAYFDQLRTQFQGGGSDIDLIAGDVSWPPQFAVNGWITDLSDRLDDDEQAQYLTGAIAGDTFEDKLYGVPWYSDSGLLYFRSDLLEKSGFSDPPTTWDELMEMASKIQSDSGIQNGFVFTGADYEGGTVLGTEFIRNAGGDILDGDEVVIGSPEAIEGLSIQQSLVSDGIAPEAVANYQEDQASGAFLRGDAAFMRMWPYAYDFLSDPELSEIETSQVGLTEVPVTNADIPKTNVGGGWSFYLNTDAADPDAAWELIEYLSSAEQQKVLALKGSYLPTRKEVLDDPEVIKTLPAVRLARSAVESTTTPPVSPYYSDMSLAMSKEFNSNILGQVTPKEAAQNLQDELESIVSRGG
jgi:multiple sugar transport system substrate-binding protein